MSNSVTLNFPPWLQRYDGGANANAPRGLTPLTPNALGQAVIDPSVYNLDLLLSSGFTVAMATGTTANRPTLGTFATQQYLDTTLGYVITRDATNTHWINSTGATV